MGMCLSATTAFTADTVLLWDCIPSRVKMLFSGAHCTLAVALRTVRARFYALRGPAAYSCSAGHAL